MAVPRSHVFETDAAPLPSTVSLKGFDVKSHIGGFTGDVSSVLNWISQVKFEDGRWIGALRRECQRSE